MAVTKSSSRSDVKDYQRQLNDAGAEPPLVIDGIWGPLTQAQHESLGTETPNGESGTGTESSDALMGTNDDAEPRFGISGGAQLWKDTDTDESYIVYIVPDSEPPLYMRWTIPSEADVQSFFGPDQPVIYQQEYSGSDKIWKDTVDFGSSTDIANTSKNPFDSWASTMEVESQSQPWLLDDDYQELLAMSVIEGRPLTAAEVQSTGWWQGADISQRRWMTLSNGDPAQAQTYLEDNRVVQLQMLRQAGISDPDERLANFIADKVSMGFWSAGDAALQVDYMSDAYFSDKDLDTELAAFLSDNGISVDQDSDMENEVRTMVNRWLGTNFGDWDDATIASWAGKLRNESDAAEVLTETLKDQRLALFPEYDREADYNTIAAPWKQMMTNAWGELPDDSDTMLHEIIRMNNAGDAGKFLTTEGLARGNDTVVNSVQSALNSSFGGI